MIRLSGAQRDAPVDVGAVIIGEPWRLAISDRVQQRSAAQSEFQRLLDRHKEKATVSLWHGSLLAERRPNWESFSAQPPNSGNPWDNANSALSPGGIERNSP